MTVPEPPVALDGITYYIWTDIFFGDASLGAMNQFVPQLVLGNALDGSSGAPAYTPHWGEHQTWAFGAHYFFETHNATTGATQGHAAYGEMLPTTAGEKLFTTFDASATSGGDPTWTLRMGVVGDSSRVSELVVAQPYMGLGVDWAQPTTSWAENNYSNLCVNMCWELYGAKDLQHLPSSGSTYELNISRPAGTGFPWVVAWDEDEGLNRSCSSSTASEHHTDTMQHVHWEIGAPQASTRGGSATVT